MKPDADLTPTGLAKLIVDFMDALGLETVTLVFEVAPRLGGYTPASATWGAGIEKITRGHVLQLNFGNSFGTTPGMLARGGPSDEVYLGFNLSRRF